MATVMAVKRFMEAPPNERRCSMSELKEFKAACSEEEWATFCTDAETWLQEHTS